MYETRFFDGSDALDEVQYAFVEVLRTRAVAWPVSPDCTQMDRPADPAYGYSLAPEESGYGKLLVWADIPDEASRSLLTVGAYFDRDRVRGDEVHNQMITLADSPTRLAFEATGTPEELAHLTADWFQSLFTLPIVRYEWLRDGVAYAQQWLLVHSSGDLLPMVETRHVHPDIGPADRVIHIPRTK